MIHCLLVDDEPGALDILSHYVSKTPFLHQVAACLGPVEALEKVYTEKVDLIFLDIHMPELSGMDFIRLLKGRTKVILTTAYSQYALEGYEYDVVDYLLKPIPFDRFLQAARKAQDLLALPAASAASAAGSTPDVPTESADDSVFVKVDSRMQRVRFADILFVEGLGNYVTIHTPTGKLVTLLTMKEVEERLPAGKFMRVHRSYILALDKVQYIEGNQVFLDKKTAVPLGETYRAAFFKTLEEKIMISRRG
jgi:two-component system LytT family response regulator